MFLGNQVWVLTHKAKTLAFQNLFKSTKTTFKQNLTKNQLVKSTKQPVVCCFYCMKKGHSVRFCKIRKVFISKGILKWVPKILKVPKVATNTHGPKFIRGPNLAS